MKQVFQYGEYSYEYYVEFGERKSYTLVVRPDLRIIARVPLDATLDDIEGFLRRKWRWLERQLRDLRKLQKSQHDKEYVSGEAFYYLGRQYTLLIESAKRDTVKLERGHLHVYTTKGLRNSAHNKALIDEWYAAQRERVFKREYLNALKLFEYDSFPQLRERVMARRWGSYTADNKISLNPRLIQAPREAIRYVCIHELCHVTNRKHDEVFYKELEKRMPEWRRVKESLEIRFG